MGRIKDKKEFSTLEKVLDLKTKKLIKNLIKNGTIDKVTNCISSGKEAVVYQTTAPNGDFLALKIFKRSAMDFRKREKYFEGDFRFRNSHLRVNVRKMVKLWAEKEFRNLKIIEKSDILCPSPMFIKNHMILMSFIGVGDKASPRLKDVPLSQ